MPAPHLHAALDFYLDNEQILLEFKLIDDVVEGILKRSGRRVHDLPESP